MNKVPFPDAVLEKEIHAVSVGKRHHAASRQVKLKPGMSASHISAGWLPAALFLVQFALIVYQRR